MRHQSNINDPGHLSLHLLSLPHHEPPPRRNRRRALEGGVGVGTVHRPPLAVGPEGAGRMDEQAAVAQPAGGEGPAQARRVDEVAVVLERKEGMGGR